MSGTTPTILKSSSVPEDGTQRNAMKRYKKKPKPKSRAALLRENKDLLAAQGRLFQTLAVERNESARFKNEAADVTYKLRSRVQTLEERLDGLFKPVSETRFKVGAFMECPVSSCSVFTDGTVGLSIRLCVDEFRMHDRYDKQHLKAHIKDMLLRQMDAKIEEALRVL